MKKSEIVVVIGPGRSGTSLAMNLLVDAGMRTGRLTEQVDTANPMGDFEDQDIIRIHEAIYNTLGILPLLPRDIARTEFGRIRENVDELTRLVAQAAEGGTPWGFKDPRTSSLLPVWDMVFRAAGVTPRYVLCVRHPGAVATSMKTHFARSDEQGELLWATRVAESLLNAGSEAFLLHYEDWFRGDAQALELATRLLEFAGLSAAGAKDLVEKLVRPNLNRSAQQPLANPLTQKLYDAVRAVASGRAALAPLAAVARETKQMTDFYAAAVQQAMQPAARKVRNQHEAALRQVQDQLQERIAALEQEASSANQRVIELQEALARLREVRDRLERRVVELGDATGTLESRLDESERDRARLQSEFARVQQEHGALMVDMAGMVEEHRRVVLRLKMVADDNEKLRILTKVQSEPARRRENAEAAERKAVAKLPPAVALARPRRKEPAQLTPLQRKMRKLVRTPGLFFADWYTKVRA